MPGLKAPVETPADLILNHRNGFYRPVLVPQYIYSYLGYRSNGGWPELMVVLHQT